MLLVGILCAQDRPDWEIPVVSKRVGTTIDIPEQEYYQVFDNIDGFLSANFVHRDSTFQARIRTANGWLKRNYSARQFYDLGLSIDLLGDINPAVLARLKGVPDFERVMETMRQLPVDVSMTLYLADNGHVKGRYVGLDGHHFMLRKKRSRNAARISIGKVTRLKYRDPPIADIVGDTRIFALTSALGMGSALALSLFAGVDGFNARASHFFAGGLVGLALAPLPIRQVRILRGELHQLIFSPGDLEKVRTYLFVEYGEL